ncbi:virulence factor SrfC family protein [Pseudomonas lundensis]|uniref:virulence factor SrfC family protein n=1 Tax=Serratia proteamaculans TaxID=28151 RepID=UPI002982363F|nr:virulence factor SrfC family protein [Serratia proteamaculans]MDW5500878.1 virulence factor SrfC family protein [Serratia proteamaculans]MDW5505942.1 virulence factor SrfC family protein [Pseudomonas lundensis]
MKPITASRPEPINRLANSIEQAIDWVAATRQQSTRLNREADNLTIRLRRSYNRAKHLGNAMQQSVTLGLYGHNTAAKAHLLAALAPGARLLTEEATLAVRYCSSDALNPPAYPVAMTLLDEAQLIAIMIGSALMGSFRPDWDAGTMAAHIHTLERHRQPMAIDGLNCNAVVALWSTLRQQGGKWQTPLERHFWPQAISLAPYLSVDDRARLFAPLWGEDPTLTTCYRQLAHTLHALGHCKRLYAPRQVLNPDDGILHARAIHSPTGEKITVLTEQGASVDIALADLAWLAAMVTTTLPPTGLPAATELLDLPTGNPCPGAELLQRMQQAKRANLLILAADGLHANLLLVNDAARTPQDASRAGNALAYWVRQTQGESAEIRYRRKPGLIWAITAFDSRQQGKLRPDDAVQRYVGEPGESWATLLAVDESDCRRMVAYLAEQACPTLKQARILEQQQELRRELSESLLGNWLHAADSELTQQRTQHLLRSLQAQAGVHGELLEWLLPQCDTLRQLYGHQQHSLPAPAVSASPFDVEIDLFGEGDMAPVAPAGHDSDSFAQQVFTDWINHLRGLPDNAQLLAMLGVGKPHLEMLVDALITAACRLGIAESLERTLSAGAPTEDRQVSQALAILSDFVTWLGFQQREVVLRPASRINHGQPIFTPPPQPAVNWGNQQRLTKLAPTPARNTAFYIYDWLVGLQTLLAENKATEANRALEEASQAALAFIVARLTAEPAG